MSMKKTLIAAAVLLGASGAAIAAPITLTLDFEGLPLTTIDSPRTTIPTAIAFDIVVDDDEMVNPDQDGNANRGVFNVTSARTTSMDALFDGLEVENPNLRLITVDGGLFLQGDAFSSQNLNFSGFTIGSDEIGDFDTVLPNRDLLSTLMLPTPSFTASSIEARNNFLFDNGLVSQTGEQGALGLSGSARAVDEPAMAGLLGFGALGMMWARRRRRSV